MATAPALPRWGCGSAGSPLKRDETYHDPRALMRCAGGDYVADGRGGCTGRNQDRDGRGALGGDPGPNTATGRPTGGTYAEGVLPALGIYPKGKDLLCSQPPSGR
jgi:hypothetical protein